MTAGGNSGGISPPNDGGARPEDEDCPPDDEDQDGTIYLRSDADGAKPYVGQAKSAARYAARQGEHGAANPDADYRFDELGNGLPQSQLDRFEQYFIQQLGGPTNKGNPNGGLANRQNQMNPNRYLDAGGDPLDPPVCE